MLAVLVAWIAISFILLSFGDMFISLYNTIFRRQETYNMVDTFMIGIVFIIILLSATSFFFPSNHYVMAIYLFISVAYWFFNRRWRHLKVRMIKNIFFKLDKNQKRILILFIFSFLFYIAWRGMIFDAIYYHYQNIRWYEEYPVTPGIGNLKDQMAFNSNYFLISAIFTFRFLFQEPLYLFQDVLFTFVIAWVCLEAVNSGFKLDRIVLLILLFIFFFLNSDGLTDSSTDIVPNICIIYYISRFALYPQALTKKLLLAILLPVALITFKLSVFPFCFISLYLFFYLIKKKKYSLTFFYALVPFLVLGLWVVRNVIVSGYLVYPIYQIDLFNFDWKIPKAVAEWQYNYIYRYAKDVFVGLSSFRYFHLYGDINDINDIRLFINVIIFNTLYLFILLSPVVAIFNLWKGGKINKNIYILYCSTLFCIIYWLLFGPDPRFALGSIVGIMFLIFKMILSVKMKKSIHAPKMGLAVFSIISILVFCMSIGRAIYFAYKTLTVNPTSIQRIPLYYAIYEPYSSKYYKAKEINISSEFSEYITNGVCIYISKDKDGRSFDKIPCMPLKSFMIEKVQNMEIIEARGPSIQDGFRVKEEYKEKMDSILKK